MPTYDSQTTRTGAAALIPEEAASLITANVQTQSAVLQMATRLPNMSRQQTRIPVISSLPVAYFLNAGADPSDTGLKQTTSVDWTNVYLNAEELAVIVPIPENVLDDSDYPIWQQITPLIEAAFAKAIDAAILVGTNAPNAWPDDLYTACVAASHSLDDDSFTNLYQAYLGVGGAYNLVEEDGFMVNGVIALPTMKARLRGIVDGQQRPIFLQNLQSPGQYELDGAPIQFLQNAPFAASTALSFQGDWKQLVWSLRQDMRWKLLTESVIQDGAGSIIYNLAQQDMVAMRVTMRVAWACPNVTNQVNPTAATRFPFSVLHD